MAKKHAIGTVGWIDLTVHDAKGLKSFYEAVVGWKASDITMGGYSDYAMIAKDGEAVTGVCHARGENAGLPSVWLIYITVENLDTSLKKVLDLGGKIVRQTKELGDGRYAVIQDPQGVVSALFQQK